MTKAASLRVTSIVCALLLLFSVVGCSKRNEATAKFAQPKSYSLVDSVTVDENGSFALKWDKSKRCVMLEDKSDGYIWSSIPYDFYLGEETNASMNSPLFVDYVDSEDGTIHSTKAYTASIKKKSVSADVENKKLKIIYTFAELEFSIPVVFSLNKDSLEATIDAKNISEGANRIYTISLLPYMCSAVNSDSDSYLFVPSGCGALMKTDTTLSDSRTFSAEVFGDDLSRKVLEIPANHEDIKMPVFGVKSGNNALLGVITDGAESAEITAEAGNAKTNHSNVYASFVMREYDLVEARQSGVLADVHVFADKITTATDMSVCFYPLKDKKANFVGMAEKYREYLTDNGMKASKKEESPLSINILGGTEVKDFMVGVPYRNLYVMTNFKKASKIISEIAADTGLCPEVQLSGFGTSGLYPGRVGGGFKFASDFGSKKDLNQLIDTSRSKASGFYMNFELSQFRKGANGFSTYGDSAKTANNQRSYQYFLEKNVKGVDEDQPRYILLSRGSINKAFKKMISFAQKKDISGVSIGSLSEACYSDYNDEKYYSKANMGADISESIKKVQKNGISVAVSDANSYAAQEADIILDAPISSDNSFSFDMEVPFYQIVFKGYKPMNSVAVNNTANERESILKAMSFGCGISFKLLSEYNSSLLDTPFSYLSSSVYADNRENISRTIGEFKDYYKSVKGAQITDYEIITGCVSRTVFNNGISVIVNTGDKDYDLGGKTVKAMNYIIEKGDVA